ncbi:MAG: Rrf2 family transcriptional regulator [Verrucomicrobiota bacterium]
MASLIYAGLTKNGLCAEGVIYAGGPPGWGADSDSRTGSAERCAEAVSGADFTGAESSRLVKSEPGTRGGYRLGKSPDKITLGDVIRHFDGILAPIDCVSVTGYKRCSQENVCDFEGFSGLDTRYVASMDRATLAEVARQQPVSASEISDRFAEGAGI